MRKSEEPLLRGHVLRVEENIFPGKYHRTINSHIANKSYFYSRNQCKSTNKNNWIGIKPKRKPQKCLQNGRGERWVEEEATGKRKSWKFKQKLENLIEQHTTQVKWNYCQFFLQIQIQNNKKKRNKIEIFPIKKRRDN